MIKVLDYNKKNAILKVPADMVVKLFGLSGLSKKEVLGMEYDFPLPDEKQAFRRAEKYKKSDYITAAELFAKFSYQPKF